MKIINPILPIMDTILGDLTSLQAEGKITIQTIERVALQWYESERNILRKTTNMGREVAFRLLKEGQRLKHDDVVFITAKIENMRTQAEDLAAGRKAQSTDDLEEDGHDHAAPAPQPQELKPFGFLAVCAGDGLAAVFADLGADGIVNGGQTMNPSTESILTEVERIAAETVFVLPNNKNIVMAAQQCAGLSEKKVIVIPTATVPQGISAMMAVDPDETDAAAIEQAMNAAASAVTTAQITYAARNSEFDGFAIREGDYLALLEGKLFDTDTSIGAVLEKLAAEADSRGAEFVNLFYGSDVSEEDAQKAGEQFGRLCPGAEINVVSGGQPVYYYIISME